MVPMVKADSDNRTRLFRCLAHSIQLSRATRPWLLDEDVLTARSRRLRNWRQQIVCRADEDCIDILVRDGGLPVGASHRAGMHGCQSLCSCCIQIAADGNIGSARNAFGPFLPDQATTDYGNTQGAI